MVTDIEHYTRLAACCSIQLQAHGKITGYVTLRSGLELRALQRLTHTTKSYHFDGLVLIDTILAAFATEAAELNTTKPKKFQYLYSRMGVLHLRSCCVTDQSGVDANHADL